jgi:ubiquinone/menaquinone biosynthesis C-methylase UbiE
VRRFRYGLDPLCLLACGLYAVCRWLVQPHTGGIFWHGHATDFLLIPAALPLVLWGQRRLGLRTHDGFPTGEEIVLHLAAWSFAAECVAPLTLRSATGDWLDVLAYATGALAARGGWAIAAHRGFDLLAPYYPWMERLLAGPRLQRCRTTWIAELAGTRHLLVAGVGHGPALAVVLRHHPEIHITCVDASERMLAVARQRAQEADLDLSRLEFVHATLPDWQPPAGQFDAIATHFFLDCFAPEQLGPVVSALARAATPHVRWIVSDFTLPPHGPARWRALAVHRLMYFFFRITTHLPARRVTPPDPVLAAHGFRLLSRKTHDWGLLQADLWQRAG